MRTRSGTIWLRSSCLLHNILFRTTYGASFISSFISRGIWASIIHSAPHCRWMTNSLTNSECKEFFNNTLFAISLCWPDHMEHHYMQMLKRMRMLWLAQTEYGLCLMLAHPSTPEGNDHACCKGSGFSLHSKLYLNKIKHETVHKYCRWLESLIGSVFKFLSIQWCKSNILSCMYSSKTKYCKYSLAP